jgi:hypothetical protein
MNDRLQSILSLLRNVKETSAGQFEARCPAHDDKHASLSISTGADGRVLLHCHAGCSSMSVCQSLGLKLSSLMPPRAGKSSSGSKIVAAYDYIDSNGELLFQVCRFEPKDFRQRRPDGNGGWLWDMNGVQRILYRLPEIIAADPSTPILIVEGEKDADNLAALGFVATCNPGGAGKWHLVDSSPLLGRNVVIIPDKDRTPNKQGVYAGYDHAARIAASLPDARGLILPGDAVKDASDWIAAGGTADLLHDLLKTASEPAAVLKSLPAGGVNNTQGATPTIKLGVDEWRCIEESIDALSHDPMLYHRGNMLVRVMRDAQPDDGIIRSGGSPTIAAVPVANLRERLTRFAMFTKQNREGEEVATHPAGWLVSGIHARGEWGKGIRPLLGTSDSPILRPDGSVWQTAGYDSRTGVLFEPGGSRAFATIQPDATADDADAALQRLLEVVCDFRFEADEHRAAWLAGLLTPLARFAFEGPSPLFLIDANVRAAGKGLLSQTIGRIVLGREMPVSSYSHDSQEMRKRITACAMAGDRMLLLDNLEGIFGNDAIDRALTSTRWKDRILGKSEEIELPLLATWYATGNNVQVAADTTRRIIHIRLNVPLERPEDRSDFTHPNLLAWLSKHRPQLLADAMTILSAYCNAGRPSQNLTPFGSFEGWSGLVRSAVVWVGLDDPCKTRTLLVESSDTTADALSQLIQAWREIDAFGQGFTVAELISKLYPADRAYAPIDGASVAMRAALENLVGCPPGRTPSIKGVSFKLRSFKCRVIDGCCLDTDSRSKQGVRWKLITPSTSYASEKEAA